MKTKKSKSKYDTNPLEGDVARRAEEEWAPPAGAPTEEVKGGATRDIGRTANEAARLNVDAETPTRKLEDSLAGSYPSVFIPPIPQNPTIYQPTTYQPPAAYQPRSIYAPPPIGLKSGERLVEGLGMPEKWATMLPYAPFYIGAVVAVVELFLIPRTETKARFHAAQALALHLAFIAVGMLFSIVKALTDSGVGSALFSVAATVFLIISMVRVWKGEPHHIAPLTEPANWLNDHIKPRKK